MELMLSPIRLQLLSGGTDVLITESADWLGDINLWKEEIAFFEHMLGTTAAKAERLEDKKQLEHLQNKAIYYSGEVMDVLRHDIGLYRSWLEKWPDEAGGTRDSVNGKHEALWDRFSAFKKVFREFKREMFSFVEKLL
jgi:hypothetical protein